MNDSFKIALSLHQSGKLAEAEKIYKTILEKDPLHADSLRLLGILYAQQGLYQKSLECFNEAIKLDPASYSCHNSLGNVYKNLGDYTKAIEHFEIALKLNAHSAVVHNNLAALYHKLNQLEEAIDHYKKAISINPDYAEAHYNLANIYTKKMDYPAAIEHAKIALHYEPDLIQAHTLLGQLYYSQNKINEAIACFKARIQHDPAHAETQHLLATAYMKQSKFDEAIFHFEQALQYEPNHPEALHNLGSLYLLLHKPTEALQYFLRKLQSSPDLDTYYNIGVIYMYQDRHEEALQFLSEALKLDANFFNAHLNIGNIYLKLEDYENAIRFYQSALELQPDNQEIKYILAALKQQLTPGRAPKEYVQHLFDQYATYFDQHLTTHLHYKVPELLYKAVMSENVDHSKKWTILDLGCGTGLVGEPFRTNAETLIGVDISEKMLEVAKQKNIYDELKKLDIEDALKQHHQIDLVIAADVFVYVGDLTQIFALCKKTLKEHGLFAFTVEKTHHPDFTLQKSARFAHNKEYIQHLADNNGFTIMCADDVTLRLQKGLPVEGYLFILKNNYPH